MNILLPHLMAPPFLPVPVAILHGELLHTLYLASVHSKFNLHLKVRLLLICIYYNYSFNLRAPS